MHMPHHVSGQGSHLAQDKQLEDVTKKSKNNESRLVSQWLLLLVKCQCGEATSSHSGYGYLQVNDFARKQKRFGRITSSQKNWVPLPKHVQVYGYLSPYNAATGHAHPRDLVPQPLQSCLKQVHGGYGGCKPFATVTAMSDTPSGNSDCHLPSGCSFCSLSTLASASDRRRVHFSDGIEPAIDMTDVANMAKDIGTPLAMWVFIDRDMCGRSLYEFDQFELHCHPYEYFHKSPYGHFFNRELSKLHATLCNSACNKANEAYNQEDLELDDALMLAGVDERLVKDPCLVELGRRI
jgi:hypothetical protein